MGNGWNRDVPLGLRFAVLERDGFRCWYCGAGPGPMTLHIDHFKPVSQGGNSDYRNLVTACADCNIGKSDRILGKECEQQFRWHLNSSGEIRSERMLRGMPAYVDACKALAATKGGDPEELITGYALNFPDPFWPRDGEWERHLRMLFTYDLQGNEWPEEP